MDDMDSRTCGTLNEDDIPASIGEEIKRATGSTIHAKSLLKEESKFSITDYGATSFGDPQINTTAINTAINAAAKAGGGTVVFPTGDYKTYTIRLKSNVNLYLHKDATIRAGRTDINDWVKQKSESGNYEVKFIVYDGLIAETTKIQITVS